MKRQWIGLGLLLAVLTVGIVLTVAFRRLHEPIAEKLDTASEAALAEDWGRADALASQAVGDWKNFRRFTAAVADHEPLEEMDSLFAQLEVWQRLREPEEFAAACVYLAELARAMADSQQLTWWNLL